MFIIWQKQTCRFYYPHFYNCVWKQSLCLWLLSFIVHSVYSAFNQHPSWPSRLFLVVNLTSYLNLYCCCIQALAVFLVYDFFLSLNYTIINKKVPWEITWVTPIILLFHCKVIALFFLQKQDQLCQPILKCLSFHFFSRVIWSWKWQCYEKSFYSNGNVVFRWKYASLMA